MNRATITLTTCVMLFITAAPMRELTISAQAQTKDEPYKNEGTTRTCIHTRLTELIGQNRPNIAGDTVLAECAKGLQVELKDRQKSYCEAVSYTGWLIADENSKLNGLKGRPYRPDRAAIQSCEKRPGRSTRRCSVRRQTLRLGHSPPDAGIKSAPSAQQGAIQQHRMRRR